MPIDFNVIPSGVKTPLFYVEFDNSMANTGEEKLKTLLIGQMVDSGKATAYKPVLVSSDSKGKELFGRGSQLARMNSLYRLNDAYGEVWAIPVADPSGGTKASATIKVTGTATASGTIYLYIGAELVRVDVANKAVHTDISASIKDAINARPDLPVTATDQTGTVTVSATGKGAYGNDIKIEVNRYGVAQNEELPEGINVQVSEMAGGNGTINLDKVITAMGDVGFEFIITPFNEKADLDKFTLLMNDVSGRWSPTKQIYGHVFTAKRGDAEGLASFGKSFNDQHLTIIGVGKAHPNLSCEVLAAYAARCATSAVNNPARPSHSQQLLGISPYKLGEAFEGTELETLLSNGIATAVVGGGGLMTSRAVTTYQRNAYGDPDNSYIDSETLFTSARVVRELRREVTSKLGRHSLVDDGEYYEPGQAITSPSEIKTILISAYNNMVKRGWVENAKWFAKNLTVERSLVDKSRVNVLFPPDYVNQLRIVAVKNQFRV